MRKAVDLTGQKFGRLTVIERAENAKGRNAQWLCKCECGNFKKVKTKDLRYGSVKSCGCLQKKAVTTHNASYTKLYKTWIGMKSRCLSPNDAAYKWYGGRGIKVCDEWLNNFQAFYDWSVSNGYVESLTLDRINPNSNYEPNNCRWVTMKVQQNNRRNNHVITYNGKTQTVKQWSEELGINYRTLLSRINTYHWTIEKAFSTP